MAAPKKGAQPVLTAWLQRTMGGTMDATAASAPVEKGFDASTYTSELLSVRPASEKEQHRGSDKFRVI